MAPDDLSLLTVSSDEKDDDRNLIETSASSSSILCHF